MSMDTIQKRNIREMFDQRIIDTNTQLQEIYQEIMRVVIVQPPERIAPMILQAESQKINDYIRHVQHLIKKDACAQMVLYGLPEATAGIVWVKIMNNVSFPKVSLCQKQDIKLSGSGQQENTRVNARQKTELKRLETARNTCIGVTAAGAVAEIITCLIVPGWTGFSGAVKIAGLVVTGAGAIGTAVSQQQIQEINRIINQVQKNTTSQPNIRSVIEEICKYQCKTNCEIICNWIEEIFKELIVQCENELDARGQ